MSSMVAIKMVEFDYGHRVAQHTSKCRNVHGHRAKVEAHVQGDLITSGSETGMVRDFSLIKKSLEDIASLFDHAMIIHKDDESLLSILKPHIVSIEYGGVASEVYQVGRRYEARGFGVVQEVAETPTAENLAALFYMLMKGRMPQTIGIRFFETPNSIAEYFPERVVSFKDFVGHALVLKDGPDVKAR